MEKFVEKLASERSLNTRKLVHGVGINDAWYTTKYEIRGGSYLRCPYYRKWEGMLKRCYSSKYLAKYPTYLGCYVSKDWKLFSNFKAWMVRQDWEGRDLDKDILVEGNKEYGEDTCIFVSKYLNTLLTNRESKRGAYAQGVCWNKKASKYSAQCGVKGKVKNLGLFLTEKEAEVAYRVFKSNLILNIANEHEAASQPRLQRALIDRATAIAMST